MDQQAALRLKRAAAEEFRTQLTLKEHGRNMGTDGERVGEKSF
jgi:hypothetical protein